MKLRASGRGNGRKSYRRQENFEVVFTCSSLDHRKGWISEVKMRSEQLECVAVGLFIQRTPSSSLALAKGAASGTIADVSSEEEYKLIYPNSNSFSEYRACLRMHMPSFRI